MSGSKILTELCVIRQKKKKKKNKNIFADIVYNVLAVKKSCKNIKKFGR